VNNAILAFVYFLSAVIVSTAQARAQELDKLSKTVVYLHRAITETVKINGEDYEVFLRRVGTDRFVPQSKKTSGEYADRDWWDDQQELLESAV
jgi:hypothetical protein